MEETLDTFSHLLELEEFLGIHTFWAHETAIGLSHTNQDSSF